MRNLLLSLPFVLSASMAMASPFPASCVFDADPVQCTYFDGMEENKEIAFDITVPSGETARIEYCATPDFAIVWEEDNAIPGHFVHTFSIKNAQGAYEKIGTYEFDITNKNGQLMGNPQVIKVDVKQYQNPTLYPTCTLTRQAGEQFVMPNVNN